MLKTQSNQESKFLRRIIAHYYEVPGCSRLARACLVTHMCMLATPPVRDGEPAHVHHALLWHASLEDEVRFLSPHATPGSDHHVLNQGVTHQTPPLWHRHMAKKKHFVVMQSVFAGDKPIHEKYDLKVIVTMQCCLSA